MRDERDPDQGRRAGAGRGRDGAEKPVGLRMRTKKFALRVIRLYQALPRTGEAQVLGKQVLRSATSVGAHYREASRARSTAEFISKLEVGLQELEETAYWMELLVESGIVDHARLESLMHESEEPKAILITCVKKAKSAR